MGYEIVAIFTTTILLFNDVAWAQTALGDACSSNDKCSSIDSSWCYVPSPTCGAGYCNCRPGFVQTRNASGCFAARRLGSSCGRGDICVDPNSECYNGVCNCSPGYSSSSQTGGVCVSVIKNVRAGDKCFDTVQCIGNLVCVDNKCGCYPEYTLSGCCDCVKKLYGDQCASTSDCINSPNAVCKQGRCSCDSNSKIVSYLTMTQQSYSKYNVNPPQCLTRTVCVPREYRMASEGETCSEPDPKDPTNSFRLCKQPYVCTACTSFKKVCAVRPSSCFRVLQSSGSVPCTLTAAFVIATLSIAALVSMCIAQ